MSEDLVDIRDLMALLGYNDERSVKKWCKARQIPIVVMGLKKYILQHYLTQNIENQLVIFVKGKEIKDIDSESDSKKQERKAKLGGQGTYQPKNEIIQKYLAKYESNSKPKTA